MVQLGFYLDNWKRFSILTLRLQADNVWEFTSLGRADVPLPWVDVARDTGNVVAALEKVEPGKTVVVRGDLMGWNEFSAIWSRILGVKARYREISLEKLAAIFGPELAMEVHQSAAFNAEFGWTGGEEGILLPEEVSTFIVEKGEILIDG